MFLPAALMAIAFAAPSAPKFEIKDGDRIVWIGSTLVEREQRYGYWETALHVAFLDKQFTLRNLGWSGDTVFGEARGRFDFNNPDACFKQLVNLTLELKPTVIFVSYGTNESFEGEAGLPKFEKGLNKLLDALKPAKARVVLFTPLSVNDNECPAGFDALKRNEDISMYSSVISNVAKKSNLHLANLQPRSKKLYSAIQEVKKGISPDYIDSHLRLTINGMHLTGPGYRFSDWIFLESLGIPLNPSATARHLTLDNIRNSINKNESLRQAIVEKNQLFFYRWRPQNETYLFGFRKHEQGKNAKEVAEFDPLVAKAEERIEELRKKLKQLQD